MSSDHKRTGVMQSGYKFRLSKSVSPKHNVMERGHVTNLETQFSTTGMLPSISTFSTKYITLADAFIISQAKVVTFEGNVYYSLNVFERRLQKFVGLGRLITLQVYSFYGRSFFVDLACARVVYEPICQGFFRPSLLPIIPCGTSQRKRVKIWPRKRVCKDLLSDSRDCSNFITIVKEFHDLAPQYEKVFFSLSVLGL